MTKSSEINVILKTPAQKTEDQTIKCNLDWTVAKLKNYISENYPLKPSINDQRLIYSGHLLKDDKTLEEIFQPSEDEDNLTFTVHLVLNQKELKENKDANQSSNELNTSSTNQSSPNLPNITQFSFNLTNDSSIDLTNLYLQQMQQYQQMYVNYMAQYYLNANNNDNQSTILPFMINPMFFNPFLMPNLTNLNTIINSTINDNTATATIQTANETERINQENQDVNDDLDIQNNWLDIFWNLLILFSLASASLSRTLFVLVVSFIYYLYKAGFFSFIRIRLVNLSRNVNNQNRNLNRNENQLQQMMDNLETPDSRNRRSDNETENENTDNQQQQSYLLDKFRFVFMIISSLFSSLMPNDINVPAN